MEQYGKVFKKRRDILKIGVKNRADAAEFAENFAVFGNAYEAAVNAGTPSEQAAAEGARLLCS